MIEPTPLPPDGALELASGRHVERARLREGGDHVLGLEPKGIIRLVSSTPISYPFAWWSYWLSWPGNSVHYPVSLQPTRRWTKHTDDDGNEWFGCDDVSTEERIEAEEDAHHLHLALRTARLIREANSRAISRFSTMPTDRVPAWYEGMTVEASAHYDLSQTHAIRVTNNNEPIGHVESIDEDGVATLPWVETRFHESDVIDDADGGKRFGVTGGNVIANRDMLPPWYRPIGTIGTVRVIDERNSDRVRDGIEPARIESDNIVVDVLTPIESITPDQAAATAANWKPTE